MMKQSKLAKDICIENEKILKENLPDASVDQIAMLTIISTIKRIAERKELRSDILHKMQISRISSSYLNSYIS